jgi:polyisoprenoid-binding protein YceI
MTTETVREVTASTNSIDPAPWSVHSKVRHLAIALVREEFRVLREDIELDENRKEQSRVEVEIGSYSMNSSEPKRDQHLRSADFLDIERFPPMHFQSTHTSRIGLDLQGPVCCNGALT